MSTSTTIDERARSQQQRIQKRFQVSWQTLLFILVVIALLAFALWMRIHDLGLPFDRDGYDEGVYWQSLLAMSAGHRLYRQIFYSQPPFFLLSIYPFFVLFGQTLWSARLGIAVMSLFGLVGTCLLGKAIGGRLGAIMGLLLLLVDPFYLSQSQRLQAEAPQIALSMLAVGLAYVWWEQPEGIAGIIVAALAGMALALGILSKLLGVAALVPLGLLMLAQLWRISRKERGKRLAYSYSLLAGVVAFLLATGIVLVPFISAYHQFLQGVVTFHTDAGVKYKASQAGNIVRMQGLLTSITAWVALFSTIVALLRRDWRVLPLLAWLAVTVVLLAQQTPLFHHHLVALIPPLVSLTIVGISPISTIKIERSALKWPALLPTVTTGITVIALATIIWINWQGTLLYYVSQRQQSVTADAQAGLRVAADLQKTLLPGQLVVTDAQFLAGLANRNTPPALVDTSLVRINTGYLTLQQLISAASKPEVQAVLFYTSRLDSVPGFHAWVAQHFRRVRVYGTDRELWVKL